MFPEAGIEALRGDPEAAADSGGRTDPDCSLPRRRRDGTPGGEQTLLQLGLQRLRREMYGSAPSRFNHGLKR